MCIKDTILKVSESLFFQRGIKSVSVDDVSEEMCISKKTFYKFFPSKENIITTLVENHIKHDIEIIEKIKKESTDAIDELIAICEFNCERHKVMSPTFVADIKKIFPNLWKSIEDVIGSQITKSVQTNIERGQLEGYFRKDIHIDFITNIYQKGVFNMLDYFASQNKLSYSELNREFIAYHLHAIGTEKALDKLKKLEI